MLVEARDVSLVYNMNKESEVFALKEVSLSIQKHEFVGVIGPSGSGKSSLLYVLSGLRKATSGAICFEDKDYNIYSENDMASIRKNKISFITQAPLLIDYLSVLDNILIACVSIDSNVKNIAIHLMECLGISHLINRKPKDLSYGQRHQVAIIRALIKKPSIIFADEPTASLDHRQAMDVMNLLKDHLNTTAIIIATHDESILEGADQTISIWDGRIIK